MRVNFEVPLCRLSRNFGNFQPIVCPYVGLNLVRSQQDEREWFLGYGALYLLLGAFGGACFSLLGMLVLLGVGVVPVFG